MNPLRSATHFKLKVLMSQNGRIFWWKKHHLPLNSCVCRLYLNISVSITTPEHNMLVFVCSSTAIMHHAWSHLEYADGLIARKFWRDQNLRENNRFHTECAQNQDCVLKTFNAFWNLPVELCYNVPVVSVLSIKLYTVYLLSYISMYACISYVLFDCCMFFQLPSIRSVVWDTLFQAVPSLCFHYLFLYCPR